MKALMSKSNALTPARKVASVSMRNLLRRISARIIPGRMASRTSLTVSCSPTVSRPVHMPTCSGTRVDSFEKAVFSLYRFNG
jgi:hypothetical protein